MTALLIIIDFGLGLIAAPLAFYMVKSIVSIYTEITPNSIQISQG